ncbi:hypothetical protein HZH66_005637 [Vespula vulgaris]|uniref:Uncharacterized protein n=1 Tax=Vespula vulgaris TaxID=7454 RepID=A0A834K5I6_VESVU|nr:hypothetical protein HZH66_005637 [Vespula vulgaris]
MSHHEQEGPLIPRLDVDENDDENNDNDDNDDNDDDDDDDDRFTNSLWRSNNSTARGFSLDQLRHAGHAIANEKDDNNERYNDAEEDERGGEEGGEGSYPITLILLMTFAEKKISFQVIDWSKTSNLQRYIVKKLSLLGEGKASMVLYSCGFDNGDDHNDDDDVEVEVDVDVDVDLDVNVDVDVEKIDRERLFGRFMASNRIERL